MICRRKRTETRFLQETGFLQVFLLLVLALAFGCQRQPNPALIQVTETIAKQNTVIALSGTATSTPKPIQTLPTAISSTPAPTLWPATQPVQTPFLAYGEQPAGPTFTLSPTASPSLAATPTRPPTPTNTHTPEPTPAPLPTPDGVYREALVPILMYHYISWPPPNADEIRRDLSVPPENLEAQLRYFQEAGYTSITFYDLIMHLQRGAPLPAKPIIFSFDDGYKDHFTNAFPLLRQYGFIGTFFPITGFLDERRPEYLSWEDVKVMSAAGMEFGVHSYTHPDLRGQTVDYIVWQTLGPKQALGERTGEPAVLFCYPFGRYDDQVIAVVRSAHYWAGITTRQDIRNTSAELFEIKRVRVHGQDQVEDLVRRIEYLRILALTPTPAPSRQTPTSVEPTATPTEALSPQRYPRRGFLNDFSRFR